MLREGGEVLPPLSLTTSGVKLLEKADDVHLHKWGGVPKNVSASQKNRKVN